MLFKSIFTNSFGILFSRVLGFIRDLLTASILGANIYSDIFFVAFKLPNLFRRIFAEGAFTQAFMPAYSKTNHKSIFSLEIFIRFSFLILLISIFVTLFSNLITSLIAFGFSDELIAIASPLVAINFYYLNLIFIVTFLATLLQYKNHFATTAFSTALLNLAMITALLISKDMEKSEIVYYLSYGVLCGGVLQVLVHIIAIKRNNLSRVFSVGIFGFKSKIYKIKDELSNFNKKFLPAVFGSSTAHISAFLDTWLASFLVSGSISYLYYANRILQLPLALFAIATSIALFPMVAKSLKNGDKQKALTLLSKSFWALLIILSVSSIIGIIFANEIMWLLFERGEFSRDDTLNSASVLVMYLIGLVPFGLAKIFSLWLYSEQKQLQTAKISAKSLGFNIVFSLLLILPMGSSGLALASSISGFVLLHLTIKEFGYSEFFTILNNKKFILLFFIAIFSIYFISIVAKPYISV
jgi:putative peptidoglycan lipid II flippase